MAKPVKNAKSFMLSDKTAKPIQTYFTECLETPLIKPLGRKQTQRYRWQLLFLNIFMVLSSPHRSYSKLTQSKPFQAHWLYK
jgi:hypothetical protein